MRLVRLSSATVLATHATPSPQRGEGGVRGLGVRVFAPNSEPPHPVLLPAGEKGPSLHAALSFLTSDDAALMTGQTLNVDGGQVRS